MFALVRWFPGARGPVLGIRVAGGTGGGITPPPLTPTVWLGAWISGIGFLCAGTRRICASMVNVYEQSSGSDQIIRS